MISCVRCAMRMMVKDDYSGDLNERRCRYTKYMSVTIPLYYVLMGHFLFLPLFISNL